MDTSSRLSTSYDRVAAEYTARIANELADKPLDRAMLNAFAEQVGPLRPICDLGCGPGHVAAFLAAAGATVSGIDLSNGMITHARQTYPALTFQQGDMRSLAMPDATLGGISAFYSIIHLTPAELLPTFQEWWRVLGDAGRVLVAFHCGNSVMHMDTWWEQPVDLDFHFLQPESVVARLQQAQFSIEAILRRAPYPDVEHPSQRAYVLARKNG